jgi:hypothetical protein
MKLTTLHSDFTAPKFSTAVEDAFRAQFGYCIFSIFTMIITDFFFVVTAFKGELNWRALGANPIFKENI